MGSLELVLFSVALGMDLFSVAIPIGMNNVRRGVILRAAAVFALFHIFMLLTGYHTGRVLSRWLEKLSLAVGWETLLVEDVAGVIGAVILLAVGCLMIWENFSRDGLTARRIDLLNGWALIALAVSVSLDALAAGFSFGMLEVDLWRLNAILGSTIFVIAIAGLSFGRKIGACFNKWASLTGGMLLILLSVQILHTVLR